MTFDFEQFAEKYEQNFCDHVEQPLATLLGIDPAHHTYYAPDRVISGSTASWRSSDGMRTTRVAIGDRELHSPPAHVIRFDNPSSPRMKTEWDMIESDPAYRGELYAQAWVSGNQLVALGVIASDVLVRVVNAAIDQDRAKFQRRLFEMYRFRPNTKILDGYVPDTHLVIGPGITLSTTHTGWYSYLEIDWQRLAAAGADVKTWVANGAILSPNHPALPQAYEAPQWLVDAVTVVTP